MSRASIVSMLLSLWLAGCATEEKYRAMLDSWVGAPEARLVAAWGVPAGVYEAGGAKFLSYSRLETTVLPGRAPRYTTTVVGNTAYSTPIGGLPPTAIAVACETTFEIRDEIVRNYSYRGNGCTAP